MQAPRRAPPRRLPRGLERIGLLWNVAGARQRVKRCGPLRAPRPRVQAKTRGWKEKSLPICNKEKSEFYANIYAATPKYAYNARTAEYIGTSRRKTGNIASWGLHSSVYERALRHTSTKVYIYLLGNVFGLV